MSNAGAVRAAGSAREGRPSPTAPPDRHVASRWSIRKMAIGLTVAALVIGPVPIFVTQVVATASPCSVGGPACAFCLRVARFNPYACAAGPVIPRPVAPPPVAHVPAPMPESPVHVPEIPVQPAPIIAPPPPPHVIPVLQVPKINPPSAGAPRIAAMVTPPRSLDAPQQAIAAAKAVTAARVNAADPPRLPTPVDFSRQVQAVASAHSGNVDLVRVAANQSQVRPRVWNWVDYDDYHRASLYNPLTEAMNFRYFYDGAYRDVYLAPGQRLALDIATAGVFPFAAVGDSWVAAGSFYGGGWIPPDGWIGPPPPDYTAPAAPQVYQDVSAYVPSDNQTVQVGKVTVVGHDDSLAPGSQDIFLLDDSTLAWGQINDPGSPSQIKVNKTQSVPGVGPIDNGNYLVSLVAREQPSDPWWPWALAAGLLAIATGAVVWVVIRRKRATDVPDDEYEAETEEVDV
jgi:hypothetical protein